MIAVLLLFIDVWIGVCPICRVISRGSLEGGSLSVVKWNFSSQVFVTGQLVCVILIADIGFSSAASSD